MHLIYEKYDPAKLYIITRSIQEERKKIPRRLFSIHTPPSETLLETGTPPRPLREILNSPLCTTFYLINYAYDLLEIYVILLKLYILTKSIQGEMCRPKPFYFRQAWSLFIFRASTQQLHQNATVISSSQDTFYKFLDDLRFFR